MKTNLKDYTYSELEALMQDLGQPSFRAKQIFTWLYGEMTEEISEMSNLPKDLRDKLEQDFTAKNIKIAKKFVSAIDETRRYLLQLKDGNFIESVLMRYHHGYTICISSQVGCAMGCAFCASTRRGKIRSLTAGEIIGQVLVVQKDVGQRISNIVMMGIGEPLDNFENVLRFLETINHPLGLNIGHRHISLSTCGLAERMEELADRQLQITLSVSLHGTDDQRRSAMMPINRKYNIARLMEACDYYIKKTNRRISFEYTLIKGVNDTPQEAKKLLRLIKGKLCHVNLIPVNPVAETGFQAGSRQSIRQFQEILEAGGIPTTVRREMGKDIRAACGQLRAEAEQEVADCVNP